MAETRALILIPARYASTRFPGKPLAMIAGQSMIERVYKSCSSLSSLLKEQKSIKNLAIDVAVVTDDDRIEDHVNGFGGKVIRVDDDVPSGTERIFLAYQREYAAQTSGAEYEFIINVQGDEPLLQREDLLDLLDFHLRHPQFHITTLLRKMDDFTGFKDPNRVKAVYNAQDGQCLYFSRSPVPYAREEKDLKNWHLHIGVYCYKAQSLEDFCSLDEGELEKIERLEQLRALGAGMRIGATIINHELIGVDTPEDIERVEGVLK
tara:strand:+ start:59377 stop:60168 length:792 start_codon:yes stop_codon:yes gene_type:complete